MFGSIPLFVAGNALSKMEWGYDPGGQQYLRHPGIIPILAHIERYISQQRTEILEQLLNLNVLVQMNAEALLRFGSRGQARSMLKNDVVQLLGSDCHNLTSRPQNLGQAIVHLEKRGMKDVLSPLARMSQRIFAEAAGEVFE